MLLPLGYRRQFATSTYQKELADQTAAIPLPIAVQVTPSNLVANFVANGVEQILKQLLRYRLSRSVGTWIWARR